jgi:hypothetical protein
LAEQLADRLSDALGSAILVTGSGSYRESERPQPVTPIVRLDHYRGRRGSHVSTAREYFSVTSVFAQYIAEQVTAGDVVIVTSAPPNTIRLIRPIRRVGAIGVYWLQDYYPELFRTIIDPPRLFRWLFAKSWDRWLGKWQHVVKAAGNLGYAGPNSRVIRNWPTLVLPTDASRADIRADKTALYVGNLGYCHELESFLETCQHLRSQGYIIRVRGDGPGMSTLPDWVDGGPQYPTERELASALARAELHLVAGHPKYPTAVFPSKFWNAHLTGKQVVVSGFVGEMLQELAVARTSNFAEHIGLWVDFLAELVDRRPAIR